MFLPWWLLLVVVVILLFFIPSVYYKGVVDAEVKLQKIIDALKAENKMLKERIEGLE